MSIENISEKSSTLAAIIDSSEDAIVSKTLEGIITSWNKAAEKMFEYSETEVVGRHISLIIPKNRLQEEDMIISALRQGKKIAHFETIRVTKSGKELNISLSVSPVRNKQGKIVGASKIARDITKQKQAELLIKQYINRLEVINATGKKLAKELDINRILQKTIDATTNLCGAAFGAFFHHKTNVQGKSSMCYALSGAMSEAFDKSGIFRNTELFDMTFSGRGIMRSDDITTDPRYGKNSPYNGMPEGHLPVKSYLAVPVFSQSGIVMGGLFFGHPEPAMFKQEHEKLVEAIASQAGIALDNAKLYQEVQTLNKKKDEFIGFASHELKTPLTAIIGYIQLMRQMPNVVNEILPKVEKLAHRLSEIINELLDISKIQAGKLEFKPGNVKLNTLITENVDSARRLSSFHEIVISLPAEDIILKIDGQKMSQVLMNVLANSIKYSPDSKKIKVTAERLSDSVKISVSDQGIGIAHENLERIFDQFYRVAKHDRTSGLGLGLYLCKEFVEAHHGTITAESEEGKGTTVHIILPINFIAR